MRGLVYDAGALVAADKRGADVLALHREAVRQDRQPLVPSVVLAQAWRGGPQPLLSRLLQGCRVVGFDEPAAREVGAALARVASGDIVDAAVVLCAIRHDCIAVTGDPDDLALIAAALGREVPLIAV